MQSAAETTLFLTLLQRITAKIGLLVQYKYLRVHSKIIDGRCCAARPCSSIASLVVGSHGLGLGFGLEGPAWLSLALWHGPGFKVF